MWIITVILLLILFFPAIILFDYHKKHNIHKSIWFLVFFCVFMLLIRLCIAFLGLTLVNYLLLIPVSIFGVLFAKNRRKKE